MRIERTVGNISFKGPMGPGRPAIPTFKGAWHPGMNMYVLSGGAKAYIPTPQPSPTTKLNYFA